MKARDKRTLSAVACDGDIEMKKRAIDTGRAVVAIAAAATSGEV
jgi:hypothetical protein